MIRNNMDGEIWMPVKGYEGLYEISNYGRIWSLPKEYILKTGTRVIKDGQFLKYSKNHWGYFLVTLYNNTKRKTYQVHRLVAITFLNNDKNLPQVNHIDGNKINNYLTNLEWCDQSHNIRHAHRTGLMKNMRRGENHPNTLLTKNQIIDIKNLRNLKYKVKDIADIFNISISCVESIIYNKNWK